MNVRFAPSALMAGNFVIGVSVLAPTGMLTQLATGLTVSIRDAGLLITYGAIVLCFGSPLVAWATSRLDRRVLMSGTLLLLAVGTALSAFAPDYEVLAAARLGLMAIAAIFTPQAASTVAQIVPEKDRPSAITYVFLGWSLAIALGMPIVTYLATNFGWRAAYGAIAMAAAAVFVLVAVSLPSGLKGAPLSLKSWGIVFGNELILKILTITALATASQFAIFTYLAPILTLKLGAGTETIAAAFIATGIMGFLGNVAAGRIVRRVGALRTSAIFLSMLLVGGLFWSASAISPYALYGGILFLGLGFAAMNSMQQARLVSVAPSLSGASVALNTSSIYIGQAVGSWLAGALFAVGKFDAVGIAAVSLVAVACVFLWLTRDHA